MKTNITDRLTFLAENFDVFEDETEKNIEEKITGLVSENYVVSKITNTSGDLIALLSKKVNDKNRTLKKVSVSTTIFSDMISADPTENKIYLQWMLGVFTKNLKNKVQVIQDETSDDSTSTITEKEAINQAIRFASEDLPQANAYLILFEGNKRKKKFIELCKSSYGLRRISDPSNINQYNSLSQLFDAVDPFIEKEPSAVERTMNKFVESGQAEIPVKDRKFTLFIPKTTAANVIFDDFANWCTAKKGNGMFKSYTEGHKKPNGNNSDIYIIINNKFFSGESDEIYQIHFETNQLKDRKNGQNTSIFEEVISVSDAIKDFFYSELITMAKEHNKGIETNKYLDFLIKFGFSESLFEMFPVDTLVIRIMKREVPKLPDLSRFKNIDQFIITDAKLTSIHPSIGSLTNLEILVLDSNKIKSLPKEIGNLKKLEFLNLNNNEIEDIPNEITYLDKSNGGSLHRIVAKEEHIGSENYQKLKRLLPETLIN